MACRPAGIVSVPGVYGGNVGPVAMGAFMNKGLTMKTGQTSVRKYMPKLLKLIEAKKIDLASVITHRTRKLEDGPELYKTFRDKEDGCVKVVIHPSN
jgi:threonine dehydrogenase-like Zn-dependent dehydrogenase